MDLRARFDSVLPGTVGLEEEVLLLDARTFEPLPVAAAVVERAGAPPWLKRELPAAQVELVTQPHASVADALDELRVAREALARAADGIARPAAAALHPTAPAEAEVSEGEHYGQVFARYGCIARRQLLGALQVHVAVGGADRTLAVYNALRGLMPELAALAAAAPFHDGRDSGLASMRPLVAGQLPRQGVAPPIASWEAFAADLRWGARAGGVPEPASWWWELRPHVRFGTLEMRVPDVQPTIAAAAGVAGFATALVAWLVARHDAGEALPVAPDWRIAENRWAALRDGVEATLADLVTGEPVPARERLHGLVDAVAAHAAAGALEPTRALIERNTALQLREAGLRGAAAWLADAFTG
jgi:carboxylate-amine ligase